MRPYSGLPLKLALVAGESSGDQLGAALISALRARAEFVEVYGIGGERMTEAGLRSLFPISDIAVMGLAPVVRKLPLLLRRIRETAQYVTEIKPDALVIIDSPDFTHRVARRVRSAMPELPIINYVSPSVWAWRPGRARKMAAYINHVLALLPFEPGALKRLGGPPATYAGHPLIERLDMLQPGAADAAARGSAAPLALLLPGSRHSEIRHLMPVFGEAAAKLADAFPALRFALPAAPRAREAIQRELARWRVKPLVLDGEAAKFKAFRQARVALAASGTVTLELAFAGIPTVVAYRGGAIEAFIARRMVQVPTVVLPNLILGENVYPEFMQRNCTRDALVSALSEIIPDGAPRSRQLNLLARMEHAMAVPGGSPSAIAAEVVFNAAVSAR